MTQTTLNQSQKHVDVVGGESCRLRQSFSARVKLKHVSLQPGAKVHPDILSDIVRPSIDYVRHKKFRSGNFPSSLSNESDRLVHWCHGAPGVIHMLIMAYKVRLLYAVVNALCNNSQTAQCLSKLTRLKLFLHETALSISNTQTTLAPCGMVGHCTDIMLFNMYETKPLTLC